MSNIPKQSSTLDLAPGTRILFWFHENGEHVLEGIIRRQEEKHYVVEDEEYSYDVEFKQVIRVKL